MIYTLQRGGCNDIARVCPTKTSISLVRLKQAVWSLRANNFRCCIVSYCADLFTVNAEEGNTVAGEVMDETVKAGTVVTAVDRKVCGGNSSDGDKGSTAEVTTDVQRHFETYMGRLVEVLNGRRLPAMKVNGLCPYTCGQRRACRDTCVEVWRRRRGVFDPSRPVLLAGSSSRRALCEM